MLRRFDFQCENGHVTEHFVKNTIRETECPECGQPSRRLISPVASKLDGTSGDFPGEALKWAKRHEKAARK